MVLTTFFPVQSRYEGTRPSFQAVHSVLFQMSRPYSFCVLDILWELNGRLQIAVIALCF